MRHALRHLGASAAWALLLFPGCSEPIDELPREEIWGTVLLEGKPLDAGTIQFLPAAPGGTTEAGAVITGGSYQIARQGGPVPGLYKVVIMASAGRTEAPAGPPGGELPLPKELIPARYNTKSTLTADVKRGEKNRFDYDLKK